MSFSLQLLLNAASRLVYMGLLGLLNQQTPNVGAEHAALLANAHGLGALFTLNVFQHYIACRTTDPQADLAPCQTQFKLIASLAVCLLAMTMAWPHLNDGAPAPLLLLTVLAALALALPELVFTMATARDWFWRPLTFYGIQTLFYIGYGLALLGTQTTMTAVLWSSIPVLIISVLAFATLRTTTVPMREGLTRLKATLRLRLGTLVANAPIIATSPAIVYVLGLSDDKAGQIPQMLLFSSFVGALAFFMGNLFQHHGRSLLPRLLRIQGEARYRSLAILLGAVLLLNTGLALPLEFVLAHLKSSFHAHWPSLWYVHAIVCASAAVVLQWYITVSMHHARSRPVLATNLLYLLLACALSTSTLGGGLHVFAVLAICGLVRSLLNIADFFLMGRP